MVIMKKMTNAVFKILEILASVSMAVMLCVLIWQVFSRYVLKNATGWTSEVTMILFVWTTFLGAAMAVKSGGHVATTILVSKLKGKVKTVVKLIGMLLCEAFFFMIFSGGLTMVRKFRNAVTPHLRIPMPYVYSAFVVAGGFMLIFGLEWIITYVVEMLKPAKQPDSLGGGN